MAYTATLNALAKRRAQVFVEEAETFLRPR
jgi:hypothetical protein